MAASEHQDPEFPHHAFADVLQANAAYAADFHRSLATGTAQQGLAVITCVDSRIDPLGVLGMKPGDAKILRNAGARVSDDVLRTLTLVTHLLGVHRVLLMPHTDCAMAESTEADLHGQILQASGVDTRSVEFRTQSDQIAALHTDLARIRSFPLLRAGTVAGGAIYDVASGRLQPIG